MNTYYFEFIVMFMRHNNLKKNLKQDPSLKNYNKD